MGPSGSGKTTLLGALAGQMPYSPAVHLQVRPGRCWWGEAGCSSSRTRWAARSPCAPLQLPPCAHERAPPCLPHPRLPSGHGHGQRRARARLAPARRLCAARRPLLCAGRCRACWWDGNSAPRLLLGDALAHLEPRAPRTPRLAQLTVRETLLMAAELRLPASTPAAEREALVDGVIGRLGLAKVGGWEGAGCRRAGCAPAGPLHLSCPTSCPSTRFTAHAPRAPGRAHAGGRRQDARPVWRREEAAVDRGGAHLAPRRRVCRRTHQRPGRVQRRKGAGGWAGGRVRGWVWVANYVDWCLGGPWGAVAGTDRPSSCPTALASEPTHPRPPTPR